MIPAADLILAYLEEFPASRLTIKELEQVIPQKGYDALRAGARKLFEQGRLCRHRTNRNQPLVVFLPPTDARAWILKKASSAIPRPNVWERALEDAAKPLLKPHTAE